MQIPNRFHHSKKAQKPRLKPQAVRARRDALRALKRKLQFTSDTMRVSDDKWSLGPDDD